MTDVRHFAYISTGKLSAMFTLWRGRHVEGLAACFVPDTYICNLAATGNDEDAETKARDYCERMSARMGVPVSFNGFYDEPQNVRRGKLSVFQTHALEAIEAGKFPFGKHKGTAIEAAPEHYILFFADKHDSDDVVTAALAARCMGVAMERDLIAKRETARAERAEQDAKSAYIGTIGERREFTGEVVTAFEKKPYSFTDEGAYWITKIRCGNDLVTYIGNKLADRGATITFKATIKRHDEYKSVKSTIVNRPKIINTVKAEA